MQCCPCWPSFRPQRTGARATPPEKPSAPQMDQCRETSIPVLIPAMVGPPTVMLQFLLFIDGYPSRPMHLVKVSDDHTDIKYKNNKVMLNDQRNLGQKPHGAWCWARSGESLWIKWSWKGAKGTARWHHYMKVDDWRAAHFLALPHPEIKHGVHLLQDTVKFVMWILIPETNADVQAQTGEDAAEDAGARARP